MQLRMFLIASITIALASARDTNVDSKLQNREVAPTTSNRPLPLMRRDTRALAQLQHEMDVLRAEEERATVPAAESHARTNSDAHTLTGRNAKQHQSAREQKYEGQERATKEVRYDRNEQERTIETDADAAQRRQVDARRNDETRGAQQEREYGSDEDHHTIESESAQQRMVTAARHKVGYHGQSEDQSDEEQSDNQSDEAKSDQEDNTEGGDHGGSEKVAPKNEPESKPKSKAKSKDKASLSDDDPKHYEEPKHEIVVESRALWDNPPPTIEELDSSIAHIERRLEEESQTMTDTEKDELRKAIEDLETLKGKAKACLYKPKNSTADQKKDDDQDNHDDESANKDEAEHDDHDKEHHDQPALISVGLAEIKPQAWAEKVELTGVRIWAPKVDCNMVTWVGMQMERMSTPFKTLKEADDPMENYMVNEGEPSDDPTFELPFADVCGEIFSGKDMRNPDFFQHVVRCRDRVQEHKPNGGAKEGKKGKGGPDAGHDGDDGHDNDDGDDGHDDGGHAGNGGDGGGGVQRHNSKSVAAEDFTEVKHDGFCQGSIVLANTGENMPVDKCMEKAKETSDCGEYLVSNGDSCECTPKGEKCEFHDSKKGNNVYQYAIVGKKDKDHNANADDDGDDHGDDSKSSTNARSHIHLAAFSLLVAAHAIQIALSHA